MLARTPGRHLGAMRVRPGALLTLAVLLTLTGCGSSRPHPRTPPRLQHVLLTAAVTFRTGQVLETSNGTWTDTPAFTYAWKRCNASGAECATIPGQTTSKYTLVLGDVGHTIRSAVTGTNTDGSNTQVSAPTAGITENPYLGKSGTSIVLNGVPVRLLGYNIPWVGPSCGGASNSWFRATFPKIVAHSKANIVRAGIYQTSIDGRLSFARFDNYLAWAKRYGLRIVPVLTNEWGDCENVGTGPKKKRLSWWQSGYTEPESPYQPLSFKTYVEHFALHYANEPTVAWYQLANEPDGANPDDSCSETAAAAALRKFADTMTAVIRSVDHNHMVDLGSISYCGSQGNDVRYVSAGGVDLCDAYHDYTKGTEALPSWAASHLSQCRADGKPSFVGEAGICAFVNSEGNCVTPTTTTTLANRADDFKAKIKAGLEAGLSGYLIWAAAHSCSGKDHSNEYDVGANNGTRSHRCPVPEVDPTESVLAAFAGP
jgi:mannan endo-1,4-beta-mannosidase